MTSNIIFKNDDIFDSDMKTIVNPCNAIGIAGAGLSLIFRKSYPVAYQKYIKWCEEIPKHGDICLSPTIEVDTMTGKSHNVLHFPTKYDVKEDSSLLLIAQGLDNFRRDYVYKGFVESIAFPAIGAGLGRLSFDDVEPLMEYYLDGLDIPIEIYLPK